MFRRFSLLEGLLIRSRFFTSSSISIDPSFPLLDYPLSKTNCQEAISRSKVAEDSYLSTLFTCQSGGGDHGVKKHVFQNKKVLVRDRIRAVLDPDSDFFELCPTAGIDLDYGSVPCAGTVTGVGLIRGHLALLVASDATVKGGTSYPITVTKSLRAQELAMQNGLPCIYIVDSGGAFLPLQASIFPDIKHGGRTFRNQAVMSGMGIPQIAMVAGPCTAGGAYTPTMSDEAIMVDRIGHVFLGGPPLVKAATGEIVTHEQLGGAKLHTETSGVADHFASDEKEAFGKLRDIVSSLNLKKLPEKLEFKKPIYDDKELDYYGGLDTLGRDDMMGIVARIVDGSRFAEFKKNFGHALVVGFGHIEGQLVGILGNCASLKAPDGQKGSHFLQLCDARDIPVVYLQNGSSNNNEDIREDGLKELAKFAHSGANLKVPKVSVNVGGLGMDEMMTMCGPSFGARMNFAWPRARMSKKRLEKKKKEEQEMAQYAASRCTIDSVILPRDTRNVLSKALQIALLNYEPRKGHRMGQQRSVIRI